MLLHDSLAKWLFVSGMVACLFLTVFLGQRHWTTELNSYVASRTDGTAASGMESLAAARPAKSSVSSTGGGGSALSGASVPTASDAGFKPDAVQAVIEQNSKQWYAADEDQKKVYEYLNRTLRSILAGTDVK